MKKLLLFLTILSLVVGCSNSSNTSKKELTGMEKKVEDTLNNMTLDEKIGQMIIVSYAKDNVDNTLKKALTEVQPGGFIIFKDNITTYERTLNFVKEIKSYTKIPMFISIDEEGGNIQRLLNLYGDKITNIPYMYDVGLKNDTNLTYNIGKVIAEELRVFGINLDFAPVIDVYSNINNTIIGKRSFGNDANVVSKNGIALAKGLEDNGVVAVYKHFPGHGNTEVDSHEALPILTTTKDELMSLDLIPFIEAIENNASMIMIGHLAVPNITNDNTPASLSKTLVTDFLKKELGYNGIVITDALNMKALTNYYSDEEICGRAVYAGVDILLMPSTSRNCVASVKKAITDGLVNEEMINNSVRKILKLKYEKIEQNYDKYLGKEYLNSSDHQEVINKIFE